MPSTLKEIPRKSRQCYLGNEPRRRGTIHTGHMRRIREYKVYAKSPRSAAHGFLSEDKEWSVVLISPPSVQPINAEFSALVQQWRNDTRKLSLVQQKAMHPAYQRIIGMGEKALPLIFRELERRGEHWLWALTAITGRDDIAKPDHNFKQAVQAWLEWGRARRYL